MTDMPQDAERLLKRIYDTGLLYKHNLDLDAEVCNFLSFIESKESPATMIYDIGGGTPAPTLRNDYTELERVLRNMAATSWAARYEHDEVLLDAAHAVKVLAGLTAAPPVQSETPEEPEVVRRLKDLASDDQTLEENALLAHIRDLRSLLTQREEEITELRLEWFRKGQDSVRRRNESGCCCKIDDDGETILSPCAARQAWAELARMKK